MTATDVTRTDLPLVEVDADGGDRADAHRPGAAGLAARGLAWLALVWLILCYRVGAPDASVAAIAADPWKGRGVRGGLR